MPDLDETDLALIELLQKDARTPQAQLAAQVGLAASSVNERIRKLGERGLIEGYHARISAEAMGYDLLAFLYIAWSRPETETAFLKKVLSQSVIMEAHHVTGTWNYMLKVRVKNTRMLEGLLAKVIKAVPGIERTETIIVLSSVKETGQIPTREPEWMEKLPSPLPAFAHVDVDVEIDVAAQVCSLRCEPPSCHRPSRDGDFYIGEPQAAPLRQGAAALPRELPRQHDFLAIPVAADDMRAELAHAAAVAANDLPLGKDRLAEQGIRRTGH